MNPDDDTPSGYASPPCLAHEVDPAYAVPIAVDRQQAADVASWRNMERQRLLASRAEMSVADRHQASVDVALHLDQRIASLHPSVRGLTISAWWPIKAELNLRHWMERLIAQDARVALPVVVTPGAPLVFRLWTPDCQMVRGFWNIPVPAEGPEIVPDILLAPLVGWDDAGYRLGYGGGYFDRTLAAFAMRPVVIGVGLEGARLPTIFPQTHDIGMDIIVTQAGAKTSAGR